MLTLIVLAALAVGQGPATQAVPLPEIERAECVMVRMPGGSRVGRTEVTLRNVRDVSLTAYTLGRREPGTALETGSHSSDRLLNPDGWIQPGEVEQVVWHGPCDIEIEVVGAAYSNGSLAGDPTRILDHRAASLAGLQKILATMRTTRFLENGVESARALHGELLERVGSANRGVGAALEALATDDRSAHILNEWGPRNNSPRTSSSKCSKGLSGSWRTPFASRAEDIRPSAPLAPAPPAPPAPAPPAPSAPVGTSTFGTSGPIGTSGTTMR